MRSVEVIEYKSNGHPDTLTDLIVEDCASALDTYYLARHDSILHYNVDKALFLAGDVEIYYGGGKIKKKPCFILGGQASNMDNTLMGVLTHQIRGTVKKHLPNLKAFNIEIRVNDISANLDNISKNKEILCNDTSFGVGYYPFSENEHKVFTIRDELDKMIKEQKIPIGELYKIMLTPKGIYVSAPLYAHRIHSREDYAKYKKAIEKRLSELDNDNIIFNPDFDNGFPYMTLTGSSIECGDDGQVGRGNRYNGLITPCRPMTIEAYHGKNNRNHIGKIYSKWAFEKAKELYEQSGKPVEVIIVGKIGCPIEDYELYIQWGEKQ